MERPVDSFCEYILEDVLGHIEHISKKRLFGGYGLYVDGVIFGIITSDSRLFFKADESNRAQFLARESEPFTYESHHGTKEVALPYFTVPEEVMEDRDEITKWVYQSATVKNKQA